MYQAEKLTLAQTKAIESAKELAQLAIGNAKELADIHLQAAKDSVVAIQSKVAELISIKDPQQVFEMFKPESAQVVVSEVSAIQSKVAKVISNSNQEVVSMLDSAIDDSQAQLRQMVKEISGMAPVGSAPVITAFDYVFDATLQGFDQIYAISKDAYSTVEKSIEDTLSSFHGELAPAKKPATKKPKAIAA